jgi:hypothetical protein
MRKARRIRVSDLVLVTEKEDSFVSDLGKRVLEVQARGFWLRERAKFRREIADLLDAPPDVAGTDFHPRPDRVAALRAGAAPHDS